MVAATGSAARHDGNRAVRIASLAWREDLGHVSAARWLLGTLSQDLAEPFYAHFSPGLADALGDRERTLHGAHRKMTLRALPEVEPAGVDRLEAGDRIALQDLYARAYPSNWFDPRMLETGEYFGVRQSDGIIAAAGVHVVSPAPGVAALGNIVTDPDHRRRGLARCCTAAVCRSLLRRVDIVALNVATDNEGAIACYRGLGFEDTAPYEEWMVAGRKDAPSGSAGRLRPV